MKLLALDSSILNDYSTSRYLMASYLDHWKREHPQSELIYRDLNAQPINHLSSELLSSAQKPAEELSPELKSELALSGQLIDEFLNADEIVVSAPMYNFNIPSQLKSWLDRVLVAGRTFKYTEKGPVGLATNKRAIIISTRGNYYSGDEIMRAKDFQENYLKTVFNFVGITDVMIIRAEGLALGDTHKQQAITMAEQEIKGLFWEGVNI